MTEAEELEKLRGIRDSAACALCVLLESELKETRARIMTLENALNAAHERALRLEDQLTGMGA